MKSWPWPASPIASATATNIPPPRLTIVGCRRTIERSAATLARIKGVVSLKDQPSPPGRSLHWVGAESRLHGPQHLDLLPLRGDRLLRARLREHRPAGHLGRGGWRALLPVLPPRHGRRGGPRGRRRGHPRIRSASRSARTPGSSSRSSVIRPARTTGSPRPAAPPPSPSARRGPAWSGTREEAGTGLIGTARSGPGTLLPWSASGRPTEVPERFRFLPPCAPNARLVGVTGSPTQRT